MNMQIPAQVPDSSKAAIAELNALIARANAVQVTNAAEYAAAVEVCQRIAATKKAREEERLNITRKMDEAKKSVMDFFRTTFLDPLERVDPIIRKKLKDYDAEQERIAAEKRRAAEAEAQRQREAAERRAREEREKAAAKAKAEREEAERLRRQQEEAERRATEERERQARAEQEAAEAKRRGDEEAARKAKEEAEASARAARAASAQAATSAAASVRAEQKAETTIARADDKAANLMAHAASIVAPVVEAERPKVKGNVRRTVWKWKVADASKIDRRFLMPDESKITKQVQALHKEAAELVGGIEVWEEADLSIRGAK